MSAPANTGVSVVIITKDQKHHLQETVPSLLRQETDYPVEIIIVDSGSTDGAVEYVKKFPQVRLVEIRPEGFNYAAAFNTGAAIARGQWLIRLSGDVIPVDKTFVQEMVRPFGDERVGGTFGRYTVTGKAGYGYPGNWPARRFPETFTRYSQSPNPLTGLNVLGINFHTRRTNKIHEFAGGCCAVRKEIHEQRPFNEKVLAGEDAEYSWFLHLIGYDVVYNPRACVIHEHKIRANRGFSARERLGLTRWQWSYNMNILKYWAGRLGGTDPYRHMRLNKSLDK